MKMNNQKMHCANCGAPATTEICPYCHVPTGIDTKNADMEYPVIECHEVNLGFWNVIFPMIFAVAFSLSGIMTIGIISITSLLGDTSMFNFGYIFLTIGLVALVIALIPVVRNAKMKINGKEIEATVYGYMDDNIYINNEPTQIVKLLVDTNDGKKFILYQLGQTIKPYKINSKIKLLVYKNLFKIIQTNM